MLKAVRIISGVLIVTGGLTWTVGQAGLETTDKNLCEFASKLWGHTIEDCHIVSALTMLWALAIVAALFFFAIDAYQWLASKVPFANHRPAFGSREVDLADAISWVSDASAWGRLQKAQQTGFAGGTEKSRVRAAAQEIWKACQNGDLSIRARQSSSIDFVDIHRDLWYSARIDIEHHGDTWKYVIRATGDRRIAEYDGILVRRDKIQVLWPRREWRYDWPRLKLHFLSVWKSMKDQKQTAGAQEGASEASAEIAAATSIESKSVVVATPELVITPTSSAPKNWDRLFAIGDDGRSIWLKFLPDTKHYRADALLLIVYGQRVLRNVARLKIDAAHAAVEKTVSNAPKQPHTNSMFRVMMMVGQLQASINPDWADQCVPHALQRVGLAEGGFYQLTDHGERNAAALARDLINRA